MNVADAISPDWTALLTDHGQIGIGLDLATTAKAKSNPSSITVAERAGYRYFERLVIRWKTADPAVTKAVLKLVLDQIYVRGLRARRCCIDASNEVFFARSLQKDFAGRVPCELIKGGENLDWKGVAMPAKLVLGNLYVSLYEDNLIAIPQTADPNWLRDDRRLVQREKGSFITNLDENGGHGDTFDSGKLAAWALRPGVGSSEFQAAGMSLDSPFSGFRAVADDENWGGIVPLDRVREPGLFT